MDADRRLIEWALYNKASIQLKITEHSWGHQLHPQIFGFDVNLGGASGRGHSANRIIAFSKAISEALERSVVAEGQLPNSNGLAAHIDPDLARINAQRELIERDAFLCVYLNQYPIKEITDLVYDQHKKDWSIFSQKNLTARFFHWATSWNLEITLGLLMTHDLKRGISMALACEETLTASFSKAWLELIYKGEVLPLYQPMSLKDFEQLISPQVEDHFRLGLNSEYAQRFINWIETQCGNCQAHLDSHGDFSFQKIKPLNSMLRGAPIAIYKAHNPYLQEVYWGPTRSENLNRNRFLSTRLNLLPHPFA